MKLPPDAKPKELIVKDLYLIKIGGSLITDKSRPYKARPKIIRQLAKEIKTVRGKGCYFLIAHGSGSFGHTSAAKYQTGEGIKNKSSLYGLAVVQQDAIKINRIVNEIFLKEGLPCLSFVPSSFSLARNKKLAKIFIEPIIESLKIGILPLVFGDIILDKKRGCCIFSGESTLGNLIPPLIKAGFKINKIIQCGTTDGVYDENGKTIPLITVDSFPRWEKAITQAANTDVTGGMAHKLEESLKIAKRGIKTLIINGSSKGNLSKAILDKRIPKATTVR